jgi:hypothetical protein
MKATSTSPLLFGLSALLGGLIWLLSPVLTGQQEPWDASPSYYCSGLVVAGFIPACLSARRFWLWAAGAWVGQLVGFVLVIMRYGAGPLWPLGLVFLCFYSLLSLAGAGLGAGIHLVIRRFFAHSTDVAA